MLREYDICGAWMARKTEGHVIVCGYGIVGSKIVEQLQESGVGFVPVPLFSDGLPI